MQSKVWRRFFQQSLDPQTTKVFDLTRDKIYIWPVFCTLVLPSFNFFGDHDNNFSVFLPNHPPEVIYCYRQRSLSRNILFLAVGIFFVLIKRKKKIKNELTLNDCHKTLIVSLINTGSISHTHGNDVGIDVITSKWN